jgi:glucuronoarabinoxylan endo-1,4-beta-xylanase
MSNYSRKLTAILMVITATVAMAQNTVKIDATQKHQHITGFGGFVCSPQFQYNHMSTSDIKKVWGASSTVGCNIMRLYIPIGRNSWSQSLATAKTAKQMGLIVFASPWGQPAEWKTNGTSNAKNDDGTQGYLKKENWADYAQYLEDYVQYMRENGVELDAISIQNEPDWPASYAGCLWSAEDMASFVKTYGPSISCKVMAPETLAVSDTYANALNTTDVLAGFDIYGGHQYGGIQSAYKKLAQKGKEIWMTEYLINWNEAENNTRNFDFTKDFFNFFRAINTCMLGDFNAWVHYAAKRYYGMLGDGQRGTTSSVVTKRGYIMAHFARFVTGMTRIDANFGSSGLEGSAYLSQTGDTVVVVMANDTQETVTTTMDLPFYTEGGKLYTTAKSKSMRVNNVNPDSETCRPVITIDSQSVATALFVRSRDRQPSDMKGSMARFNLIDDMKTTKTTFGTAYKISGKTKKFDHSNPLISTRTNDSYGYIALDNRYTQLVMQVKKITSSMNYSSAKTTLIYVNGSGQVASHDYGDLEIGQRENFDLVFDLSPETLTEGITGIISMTNNNWSSTLTLTLGDVWLDAGTPAYKATLSGVFVDDDSYVLDYTADAAYTSLDMTACEACPTAFPWLQGTNRVVWLPADNEADGTNIILSDTCHYLALNTDGGNFRPHKAFHADKAELTATIDGCRLLMIPFTAAVPDGVSAYSMASDLTLEPLTTIPAHTPVVVMGNGTVTFKGSGTVSFATSPIDAVLRGTYTATPLYAGDYVLTQQDDKFGLHRVSEPSVLSVFGAYVTLASQEPFIPLPIETAGIHTVSMQPDEHHVTVYDLGGRQLRQSPLKPGIYIRGGKKIIVRR